jgi:outer membrane receptor protein involved in Fe transport
VPAGGVIGAVLLLFRPGANGEVIEVEEQAPAPAPPNRLNLRRDEITRIPGSRGDALQSIRSLPGVAATSRGGGGGGMLVIRGAAPEDSRVTIDGVEVPLLYHFFGLQSVLPSELISNIEFTPGGFGVEEGRATGGIINVVTRDDTVTAPEGFAELSFVNLAALVQTPLSKKHHLKLTAALRRSIIDLILPAVLPDDAGVSFTTAPTYYDGQLRLDWKPREADRVSLFALTSLDNLALVNDTLDPNDPLTSGATFENETSFTRVIGAWNHDRQRFANRLTVSGGFGGFRVAIADRFLDVRQASGELRDDASLQLNDQLRLRAGTDVRLSQVDLDVKFPAQPAEGEPPPTSFSMLPLVTYEKTIDNHVGGLYTAADYKPVPRATLTGGVRYDYYAHIAEWTLSPRAQASYQLSPQLTLKAAVGAYSRGLQQGELVPTNLVPERARQYVAGVEHDPGDGVSTTASVFYTDRDDLVVRNPVRAQTDPLTAYVNLGVGRSYGAELLVRVRRENLFGWAAYTYSRSDRIDRPGTTRRLFDADQPHNLILVASYKLGQWEFGGRFQYATGTPETPITGAIYLADSNAYVPTYGRINSSRIEDAHALDLRIDRKWRWGAVQMSGYLDVTNVYAHARVLNYSYNYDYTQRQAITELPIVPAIGLRGAL